MTNAELLRHCGAIIAAGQHHVTLSLPPKWRRPPGFPRFELMSHTAAGYANVSVPAFRMIAWLNSGHVPIG